MRLNDFSRYQLADLPTTLDEAPRLADAIGIDRLLIKRDDNTGLAMGGNKARNLEFLMAQAHSINADVVLTCGGPQSNHVRMTAAAARKAGMECILFMPASDIPKTFEANLLLDAVLGAEMRFLNEESFPRLGQIMKDAEEQLIAAGKVPFTIPLGGSTPLGTLGYVAAVKELAEQLDERGIDRVDIVAAVGTGGTLAGILLGNSLFSPKSRVFGISVVCPAEAAQNWVLEEAEESARLLEVDSNLGELSIHDEYIGEGYGIATRGCKEAILITARTEGIILDPIYTGKAMDGLINLARNGQIGRDRPVVFWHTGGGPGLFAHSELFQKEGQDLSGDFTSL